MTKVFAQGAVYSCCRQVGASRPHIRDEISNVQSAQRSLLGEQPLLFRACWVSWCWLEFGCMSSGLNVLVCRSFPVILHL